MICYGQLLLLYSSFDVSTTISCSRNKVPNSLYDFKSNRQHTALPLLLSQSQGSITVTAASKGLRFIISSCGIVVLHPCKLSSWSGIESQVSLLRWLAGFYRWVVSCRIHSFVCNFSNILVLDYAAFGILVQPRPLFGTLLLISNHTSPETDKRMEAFFPLAAILH